MKRARTATIAGALGAAIVASVGFMIAYATRASILLEGTTLAIALTGFVAAALGWAFWIVDPARVTDQIDEYPSAAADRDAARHEALQAVSEISRNGALMKLLAAALGVFGLAALFPFRSLGPAPGKSLFATKWKLARDWFARMARSLAKIRSK